MLDFSISKIMVLALLALLVLGPEKLPKVAAQVGRWTGRARAMARNLRLQLEQEVSYDELLKEKQKAEAALKAARDAASAPTLLNPDVQVQTAAHDAPPANPVTTDSHASTASTVTPATPATAAIPANNDKPPVAPHE